MARYIAVHLPHPPPPFKRANAHLGVIVWGGGVITVREEKKRKVFVVNKAEKVQIYEQDSQKNSEQVGER